VRGVGRLLAATLPDVWTVEVDGVGHLAPITHPDVVNTLIEEHLARMQETFKTDAQCCRLALPR
jgi:pimeloyl-ACP methyl ester carboxylesterase